MGYRIKVTRSGGEEAYLSRAPIFVVGSYLVSRAGASPTPVVFADPDSAMGLLSVARECYANARLEHTTEPATPLE